MRDRNFVILLFILAIGLILRFWLGLNTPLWLDEALQWRDSNWEWKTYINWSHNAIHAPLSFILTKLSLSTFGHSEIALRLPSILIGGANILFAYIIASAVMNKKEALIFCSFIALDPLLVEFDSSARMYSLWLFTTLLALFVVIRIENKFQQCETVNIYYWLGLGVSYALIFWSHPLGIYVWFAFTLSMLAAGLKFGKSIYTIEKNYSERIKGLFIANVLAVIICYVGLMKMFNLWSVIEIAELTKTANLLQTIISFSGTRACWIFYLCAAMGLLITGRKNKSIFIYLVTLIIVGILFLLVGKQSHFIEPKYLYPTIIPVYIGLSAFIYYLFKYVVEKIGSTNKKIIFCVFVLVVCGPLLIRASQTVQRINSAINSPVSKYEGSRLVKYVSLNAVEKDTVIYIPPYLAVQGDYYGISAYVPIVEVDERKWGDGYGYNLEEIYLNDRGKYWIIITSGYKNTIFSDRTYTELKNILDKIGIKNINQEDWDKMEQSNVITIVDGRIHGMNSAELM